MSEEPHKCVEVDEFGREVVNECIGYAYVSSNGQLVIDRHATDDEHLTAPASRNTQPMYDCRTYLRDVIPKEWIGKRGKFTLRLTRAPDGTVRAVSVAFERC